MTKPRLESAPLTKEDEVCWRWVSIRDGNVLAMMCARQVKAHRADCRDADLMLCCRECRQVWPEGLPLAILGTDAGQLSVNIGGDIGNITSYA
jgi:hypothetical protein